MFCILIGPPYAGSAVRNGLGSWDAESVNRQAVTIRARRKRGIMEQHKPHPILFVGMFVFFGCLALSRFSSGQVRTVDALGLFASGMGCGVAVFGFIDALMIRRKS